MLYHHRFSGYSAAVVMLLIFLAMVFTFFFPECTVKFTDNIVHIQELCHENSHGVKTVGLKMSQVNKVVNCGWRIS